MLLHYFFLCLLFFPIKLKCWFVWLFACFSSSHVWLNEQFTTLDFTRMENSALIESGLNSFCSDVMKSNEQNKWRLFCGRSIKLCRQSFWVQKVRKKIPHQKYALRHMEISLSSLGFSIILHRKREQQPSSGTSTYCCSISFVLKIKYVWAWGRGKVCKQSVTIWSLECRVWQYTQIYCN